MEQTVLLTKPRVFLIVLFLFFTPKVLAQKYRFERGEVSFVSNAELEQIKAKTGQIQGLLDPVTNQFAFTVDIRSFKGFNSELQREHFNEKYMESERYPKAKFSGKIIETIDFSENKIHEVRAKGELDIHGQKQTRIIKTKFILENGKARIESTFLVPLSDHNITIPSIVKQKIASEIEVSIWGTLSLQ
ncbi:YceI family protein [Chryseosolibacter indicus]|uniref:YceI family protein n=1 Tax=Chryseosolibacter indicus TaxID=2782351 RepID=A0ABS5VL21_9BACT|nr:YceI family protein [Chryseosolibacter indicus]MBT1701693.1 YceI family protein [Chryseosolibacter indicus]